MTIAEKDFSNSIIHGRAKPRTSQTIWLCANVVWFDLD
jgi:hypothetical protein